MTAYDDYYYPGECTGRPHRRTWCGARWVVPLLALQLIPVAGGVVSFTHMMLTTHELNLGVPSTLMSWWCGVVSCVRLWRSPHPSQWSVPTWVLGPVRILFNGMLLMLLTLFVIVAVEANTR